MGSQIGSQVGGMEMTRIPVFLLTGFLGSGKTTLLNQLVKLPEFSRTLVIINEFGATSLDHLLVSRSTEEQIVELSSGCICCSIRGDLAKTLLDASWRFARNGQRQFDQIVIETTGLAEPTPILHTLMNTPKLFDTYRLQGTVTVVDAVNGADTLEHHVEAQKQVGVADLLLISKTDLANEEQLSALQQQLRRFNPTAPQQLVLHGDTQVASILALDHVEPIDSKTDLRNWLPTAQLSFSPVAAAGATGTTGVTGAIGAPAGRLLRANTPEPTDVNRHNDQIRAYCFVLEQPIKVAALDQWLDALLPTLGPKLLRLKAILNVDGFPGPLVVHAVQHLLHPAGVMTHWPDEQGVDPTIAAQARHSKLVFITDALTAEQIEQTLQILQG